MSACIESFEKCNSKTNVSKFLKFYVYFKLHLEVTLCLSAFVESHSTGLRGEGYRSVSRLFGLGRSEILLQLEPNKILYPRYLQ